MSGPEILCGECSSAHARERWPESFALSADGVCPSCGRWWLRHDRSESSYKPIATSAPRLIAYATQDRLPEEPLR